MSSKIEALKFIAAGHAPVASAEIFKALSKCKTLSACVVMMSSLKKDDMVEIAGKDGKQNQWKITDTGKKYLEYLAQNDGAKPPKSAKRKKKVKAERKAATSKRRAVKRRVKRSIKKVSRDTPVKAATAPARWALTQDSAFIDLAAPGSDEISGARARSLVDFIRKLDEARA